MMSIAVVGMAGRFPGSADVEALWKLLIAGETGLVNVSEAELVAANVPEAVRARPEYVRRGGFLDTPERFDGALFGFSPGEAERLDPQQRTLLECGWTALEHAGRLGCRDLRVGVYASAAASTHLLHLLHPELPVLGPDGIEALLAGDKDFVASRLAYGLDLHGPAVMVQSACSSSLVAVHMACQALLAGDCDLALAGGVTVRSLRRTGYLAPPDFIFSPQGDCRPFDRAAAGSVPADGAALVVLRRLEDAAADGDTVHAVILASAVNNDGRTKAGFTAPSASAQVDLIRTALALAGVPAAAVGYVEAHGSATPLGDALELSALAEVFGSVTDGLPRYVGSIKGNLGHLDAASGVSGLVKAVLAVRHLQVPATLGHNAPADDSPLHHMPLRVPLRTEEWPALPGPAVACVSSFGLGGTNAHVVLQAPPAQAQAEARETTLLCWSARTPAALELLTRALHERLQKAPVLRLADIATTLACGRIDLACRAYAACEDLDEAKAAFAAATGSNHAQASAPPLTFLFPGIGDAIKAAGQALDTFAPARLRRLQEDANRALGDAAAGAVWHALLEPEPGVSGAPHESDVSPAAHAALYILEYALAGHWIELGLRPAYLLGHSVGELAAAAVAGVMEFGAGLHVVHARAMLLKTLAPGRMLAVATGGADMAPFLPAGAFIAAYNSPVSCVVAVPAESAEPLRATLLGEGLATQLLPTWAAMHGPAAETALPAMQALFAQIDLRPPRIKLISSATALPLTDDQARDPRHWAELAMRPVLFESALQSLPGDGTLLEVGASETLRSYVVQTLGGDAPLRCLASFPSAWSGVPMCKHLLDTAGRLWMQGHPLLRHMLAPEGGRRVPLPTYPFEGASVEQAADDTSLPAPDGDPKVEVMALLSRIWMTVLKVTRVRRDDTFRGLGGDSLLALQVLNAVRDAFCIELHLSDLARNPTLGDLSDYILALLVDSLEPEPECTSALHHLADSSICTLHDLTPALDAWAVEALTEAVEMLGAIPDPRPWASVEEFCSRYCIPPSRARLVEAWLSALADAGRRPAEPGGFVLRVEPCRVSAVELLAGLQVRCAGTPYAALVSALQILRPLLGEIASGRREGTEVWMIPPERPLAEQLYSSLPEAIRCMADLRELAFWAVEHCGTAQLRCLEIGGGFGVGTDAIWPALSARLGRYLFTDLSPYFLDRMAARQPAVQCLQLDMDRAGEQLPAGGFELIVASHALHCARDVAATLAQLHRCLADGGLLLLAETTRRATWHLVSMALLEGYFSASEGRRRESPFLTLSQWLDALCRQGYEVLEVRPADGSTVDQHVILARRVSR